MKAYLKQRQVSVHRNKKKTRVANEVLSAKSSTLNRKEEDCNEQTHWRDRFSLLHLCLTLEISEQVHRLRACNDLHWKVYIILIAPLYNL